MSIDARPTIAKQCTSVGSPNNPEPAYCQSILEADRLPTDTPPIDVSPTVATLWHIKRQVAQIHQTRTLDGIAAPESANSLADTLVPLYKRCITCPLFYTICQLPPTEEPVVQ